MKAIEVKNLTKKFGKFTAVNNISFNVKQGEIFGFLGANGAGKTTTIKMLCGILTPTEGDALVAGISVSKQPDKIKQRIGYMSQKFSLYNDLTVGENIEFFGGVYGLDPDLLRKRKHWALEIAGLKGKEKILTAELPGGIKQRLALGTAVIHKPPIVFLDEPTSGVDPIARRQFWELINQLAQENTTVIVTTHYLEEAEYCNHLILMDSGKIIASGDASELKNNYLKKTIYELECNASLSALEILEKNNIGDEITMYGNAIHIIASEEEPVEAKVQELLKSKGFTGASIKKIQPTLDDVFVHLLESKN